jgi:hypothetical protein
MAVRRTIKAIYGDEPLRLRMVRSIRRILDKDQRQDVAKLGAEAGWPKFTNTSDCVRWYNRHEAAIWSCILEEADVYDRTFLKYVADLDHTGTSWNPDGFKSLLVWIALEWVCQKEVEHDDDPPLTPVYFEGDDEMYAGEFNHR